MGEIKKITGAIEISRFTIDDVKKNVKDISEFKEKIEANLRKRITELLEIILAGAFFLEASDIHIEPQEEKAKLRVRIDGVLQDILYFNLEIYKALTGRIKLLSELKLNITDRAQDGRFSILIEEVSVEIRASTIPAEYGESIALRILNPKWVITMEELGLRKDLMELFKKEIQKPNGMIICTGPTGAGKTTTLYAFLKEIAHPGIKIISIEDPIEYHLEGVSQTQVDETKGYDFANGLRAIVRQDPDVILVGEIRDLETAQITLQASLTGHLVLSTVHTNDASGTIARLQALGEKPVNIAPALNLVIAQRLVRKVCKKCVEFKIPSPEELEKLKKTLKNLPEEIISFELIPEKTQVLITKEERPIKTESRFHRGSTTTGLKIPYAKGCKDCNLTGYKGRVGIFEAFPVDDEIEKFILTSPPIPALKELAIKKGMVLMHQDGFLKVLKGMTTLEEVERVTGPE